VWGGGDLGDREGGGGISLQSKVHLVFQSRRSGLCRGQNVRQVGGPGGDRGEDGTAGRGSNPQPREETSLCYEPALVQRHAPCTCQVFREPLELGLQSLDTADVRSTKPAHHGEYD